MATPANPVDREHDFPPLPLEAWEDTQQTLQRMLQIVGKVRLGRSPMQNHWWQVALYVTPRGLTTSPIPGPGGSFSIDLDFLDHTLCIATSRGERVQMALEPRPVAEFYRDLLASLRGLGIDVAIDPRPQEIEDDLTPFDEDTHHRAYDREAVRDWFQTLVQADLALKAFRAGFTGKASPVHFFWGSADLAVTLFSGRPGPSRKAEGPIVAESYADEVYSAGFWHGTPALGGPAFYAYAVPEPRGFSASAEGLSDGAHYDAALGEFILPWDRVRVAADPQASIQTFLHATYAAAANLGRWDRGRLERDLLGAPPRPARQQPAAEESALPAPDTGDPAHT